MMEPYSLPYSGHTLSNVPTHKFKLGNWPTPLEKWTFSISDGSQHSMLIKRDDLSDLTAHGNKIRKLEFIVPDIIRGEHDWILSLGPTQSNSCRVASAIATRVGLKAAHVLIDREEAGADSVHNSTAGNLFFHHVYGATLFVRSRAEYLVKGQQALLDEARTKLLNDFGAIKPYILPMGGSNLQGLFGYVQCFHELEMQLASQQLEGKIDELFFSCGSGGTAAGLALGKHLAIADSPLHNVRLTGYIAWESTPEHFHQHIDAMFAELGLHIRSADVVTLLPAWGQGYATLTAEEVQLIKSIARSSGIILDGTYTAKAVQQFLKEGRPEGWRCIFLHSGGQFSMIGDPTFKSH